MTIHATLVMACLVRSPYGIRHSRFLVLTAMHGNEMNIKNGVSYAKTTTSGSRISVAWSKVYTLFERPYQKG